MKLYLGNLPYSFTEENLKELFAPYGEVEELVIILDKFSGRSRGYGFATLKDDAMANKAIEELNGKEFDGRAIIVNESKPREDGDRAPRRFGGNTGGGRSSGGFGRRDDNRGGNDRSSSYGRRDRY